MGGKRRRLSRLEISLEIITFICIIFIYGITIVTYINAPDIIPTHFNAAGVIDGYGSKGSIIIIPIIVTGLYVMFALLGNYPQAYNYAVKITESNREKQYKMATIFIRILDLELVGIFTYIQLATLKIINAGEGNLSIAFLPITMLIVFGTIGVYVYKSIKTK